MKELANVIVSPADAAADAVLVDGRIPADVVNIIESFNDYNLAFDAKDASLSGTPQWAAAFGTGNLKAPSGGFGTAPSINQSTVGFIDGAIGASRVDQAILCPDATDPGGFNSDVDDDVIVPSANEWHMRQIVNVGGPVDGGGGALWDMLYGSTYYARLRYNTESGGNHAMLLEWRHDGAGGTAGGISETFLVPINNGPTLIDIVARNVGGVSRLDWYINGVENQGTPYDALMDFGHPSLTPQFGVFCNRAGIAVGWSGIWWHYRAGKTIDLATHALHAGYLGVS